MSDGSWDQKRRRNLHPGGSLFSGMKVPVFLVLHHLIGFFDQIFHKFHLNRLDLQESLSLVNEKMIHFSV